MAAQLRSEVGPYLLNSMNNSCVCNNSCYLCNYIFGVGEMQIFLLRHGLAGHFGDPAWPDDHLRPLTTQGINRLNQHMAALASLGLSIERILSSDYVRARQTADIADRHLGRPGVEETDLLHPGGYPSKVEALLAKMTGSVQRVMLVGHEPQMSSLVSWFMAGDDGLAVRFKKGAVVRIDFDGVPDAGLGELRYMLTPKLMDQLVSTGIR